MKKRERDFFRAGEFTDYAGNKRQFVIAAVLMEEDSFIDDITLSEKDELEDTYAIEQGLYLGISVLHPTDLGKFDENIGRTIARNKALDPKTAYNFIVANTPGLFGKRVIEALLEQEAAYFIENPSKYLKGYERDRIKFNFEKLGGFTKETELKAAEENVQKIQKEIDELKLKSRKRK